MLDSSTMYFCQTTRASKASSPDRKIYEIMENSQSPSHMTRRMKESRHYTHLHDILIQATDLLQAYSYFDPNNHLRRSTE